MSHNTLIDYFYRAGSSNEKFSEQVVLKGTLTDEQKQVFMDHLAEGMIPGERDCFDADHLGLRDFRSEVGDDGPWHELSRLETVDWPATTNVTASELLDRLVAAREHHQALLEGTHEAVEEEVDCTRISYEYLDNMGRTQSISVDLPGLATDAQIEEIRANLVEVDGFRTGRKDFFDPESLGLPSLKDEEQGDMTDWHEITGIQVVSAAPTIELSLEEFIEGLAAGNEPQTGFAR